MRRWILVGVSATQLACGLVGLAVALVRRHPYDLPYMHGDRAKMRRDAVAMGTALSAPAPMLAAQAIATVALAAQPGQRPARVLGGLGVLMVPGYLGERLVRERLTRGGWDTLESPARCRRARACGRNGRPRAVTQRLTPREPSSDACQAFPFTRQRLSFGCSAARMP